MKWQPFASLSIDGRIINCNPGFCELMGYQREELIGLDWVRDLTPPEDREQALAVRARLRRTGEPLRYFEFLVRKNGRLVLVDRLVHQVCDLRGKAMYECSFVTVVSAGKSPETQDAPVWLEKVAKSLNISQVGIFSQQMKGVVSQAENYHRDRSIPVLIEGETGTGKEIIARIIHFGDGNEKTPFVAINCAAVSANLFESELFGYEAGTFTGGLPQGQKGKLDLARGGTLFLDEVADIPLELQGKLLRVLQEKEYYRVGGLRKIATDVRVICATNVNLHRKVSEGTFRQDLYYRLKVGYLALPPLRERREEVLPLARMFLAEFSQKKGKRFEWIGDGAAEILRQYHWPGNVREVRNVIEWAIFLHDDRELRPAHLGSLTKLISGVAGRPGYEVVQPEGTLELPTGGLPLEEFIDHIVVRTLTLHGGNKAETARCLGISRPCLYRRLKRLAGGCN
ncbi:MAG: sigma 54-interacting transcriptional regulator [Heliobacteriaceae bacterium]|nr:sigma 54-interacting transcriptional regulator [Heliobacteriaceae bacterium]